MSDTIIIVDPVNLRTAISRFETSKNAISREVSEIEANIGEIQAAWKDDQASVTYQNKMKKLMENFSTARDTLQKNIQNLETYVEEAENTLRSADEKAQSLNSTNFGQ